MEPEAILLCQRTFASGTYPEPDKSSLHSVILFLQIHFNIILPHTPRSSKWHLSFRFPHQNPIYTYVSLLLSTCHMSFISHPSWSDLLNYKLVITQFLKNIFLSSVLKVYLIFMALVGYISLFKHFYRHLLRTSSDVHFYLKIPADISLFNRWKRRQNLPCKFDTFLPYCMTLYPRNIFLIVTVMITSDLKIQELSKQLSNIGKYSCFQCWIYLSP